MNSMAVGDGARRGGFAVGCGVIILVACLCGCNSDKDSVDTEAGAYFKQGLDHANADRYADAVIAYKKAVDIKPDFADAYYNMGLAYETLRQDPDAVAAYKMYIVFEPTGSFAASAREKIRELSRQLHDDPKPAVTTTAPAQNREPPGEPPRR